PMNLLVIPSWYPHRCYPWEGVFLLEQARAIAESRPDWNVALSLWGQGEAFLSTAHLLHSPRCLGDALALRAGERDLARNLVEFLTPALWWPERVFGGNKAALLRANRTNLERATRRFGRIDLMHAHVSYPAGWLALRLSEETGIPYVLTEHMGPFPLSVYARSDGVLKPTLREPLERAAARIAVSPMLARTIARFGILEPEVVPNLIDERLYRSDPPPDPEHLTFFTLCVMDPVKGVSDLLKGAARFLGDLPERDRPRARFRIGGGGPLLAQHRREAHELRLDANLAWLGQIPRAQARDEFARCDCFVLTSRHESFGIVFVEAGACGRPVIATACGGPEHIVAPETGVLVGVGDIEGIAGALRFMFENARAYDAAGIRRRTIERFGREAVVGRLESVYRRVLASSEPRDSGAQGPAGAGT
ncbi:MAG TPA: glycosyltransferase, partial [Terriglobales bacterium]|nr:glycosyltransferase [Terriglobales bacterium]